MNRLYVSTDDQGKLTSTWEGISIPPLFSEQGHLERWVTIMLKRKQRSGDTLNTAHGACFYILTFEHYSWEFHQQFIDSEGEIHFDRMLKHPGTSGGEAVLLHLALDLLGWEKEKRVSPIDFCVLDGKHRILAMNAIWLRLASMTIDPSIALKEAE